MSLTVLEQGCNNHYVLARLHQVKQSQIKLCLTVC